MKNNLPFESINYEGVRFDETLTEGDLVSALILYRTGFYRILVVPFNESNSPHIAPDGTNYRVLLRVNFDYCEIKTMGQITRAIEVMAASYVCLYALNGLLESPTSSMIPTLNLF